MEHGSQRSFLWATPGVEKHATESHKEGESAIKWTRPHLL